MRIHPHRPRLQLPGYTIRPLNIFRPDRRSQSHFRIVRLLNRVAFVRECEKGDDRAEWFFCHDTGGGGGPVDDGGRDEVAWSRGIRAADCNGLVGG